MKVVRVPATYKNAILLPDLHVPKVDHHSLYLAKRYGKEHDADLVVLTGDVMDSAAFGRHGHKPADEKIGKYFDDTYSLLSTLRNDFPNARFFWTEGNHDLWFDKFLQSKAPVLQNDNYFTIQKRLRLQELEIEYLKEDTVLRFCDTNILHGHQFFRGRFQSENPAKMIFNAMNEPTIIGHVHRLNAWHKKKPTSDKTISCYVTGCLSELSAGYNPTSNYMTGFAHLRKGKGRAIVRNLHIEKEILF